MYLKDCFWKDKITVDIGLLLTIVGTVLAVVAFPATYYMGRRNR